MNSRKHRYLLLALMVILTSGSLLLFPRININEDMTIYLPKDSRMREGVDSLRANFPEVDMNAYWVKVMFAEIGNNDALGDSLKSTIGVAGITAVTEKDGHSLFQLSVEEGADPKAIAAEIAQTFGSRVIVEHNANSIMPDNMGMILIVGVAIVFGILFLMCSSLVEALIFILTIGMAVIINMGTNAFLPSVSMMTNTIVAVLQLVLSMDYSIILMNRFRQMLQQESDIDKAMGLALKSASTPILSSAFTTIVGLLALVFMKFRIGMDLGLVLAKGVFCSLVSIYTILPAFILMFFKGIKATEKKVFLLPTDRLARFELRARIPLAIIFLVLFIASWQLSRRTELSYASIWESKINEVFQPQNSFSLIYRTEDEDRVIEIIDTLSVRPGVMMALSYPSIFKKKLSPEEMYDNISSLLMLMPNIPGSEVPKIPLDNGMLTAENLKFLYYACSHRERDERMSFEDMLQLAEEASALGLMPEGMDVGAIMAKYLVPEVQEEEPEVVPEPSQKPVAGTGAPTPIETVKRNATPTETVAEPETFQENLSAPAEIAAPIIDESGEDPYGLRGKYSFTKEKIYEQMNSAELAEYLGFSRMQASTAYSMAGKKGRNGTMSPYEFITYMTDKVLNNKILRKMISDSQAEGLHFILAEMNDVLASPDPVQEATPSAQEEQTAVQEQTHPALEEIPAPAEEIPAVPVEKPEEIPAAQEEIPASPLEELAAMYASGDRFTSRQIHRALSRAGIAFADAATIDLMFTYYGSRHNYEDSTRLSLNDIISFLSEDKAINARFGIGDIRGMVDGGIGALRKDKLSMAAIVTDLPLESAETFDFIESCMDQCSRSLGGQDSWYLVGESVMYKEMKDGFRKELVFLTLLTIISIFLIVAVSFKSVVIPAILVMTVMTGVFTNVFFSGIGGHTMLYLAYLIVQSILMGATIDYGILYTNYYLGYRKEGLTKAESVRLAYKGSIHTIMTSGLIIVSAPFIMSELLTDPTICSILSSLTWGALAALSLILLVLPAMLSAVDRLVVRKKD